MSFLSDVWRSLAAKKKSQTQPKQTNFVETFPGYRTIPIQGLQRKQANNSNLTLIGVDLWRERQDSRIYTYMENSPFSNYSGNGFFASFYNAYMRHGDLKIKPDEVWMTIMLWFTKYANDNAEQLRTAFVTHAGKKELKVQTDRNVEDWEPFLDGIIEQIRKNTVKGVVEQLECNFSSTGLFERLFSTALVMNTCKKYFDYTRGGGGCGIVNVHMAGNLQDWEKLERKLVNLQQFDVNGELKSYIRGLKPVLEQFTETFKGNAHLQFWNNLYFQREDPDAEAYEPSKFINGWLINFFTTKDEISDVQQLQNFSVDIKYVDLVTKEVTYFNLNGGCKGYSCVDGYTYTPHYSFAIVLDEKKMKNIGKEMRAARELEKHKERIMKKGQVSTPIVTKKVNLQFGSKLGSEGPVLGFHPQPKKEMIKELKAPIKLDPYPSIKKPLVISMTSKRETEQKRRK